MKKLFLFLLISVTSGSLFAALQFDTIKANSGVGVTVTQGGNLYLSTTGSALPSGAKAFGYYTMDAQGKVTGGGTIDLAKLSQNGGLIGDFAAGTQIGFWLQNQQGAYYDSIYRDEQKGDERQAAYVGNNGNRDNVNMIIGAGGFGNGYSPYKGDGSKSDLIFSISNSTFGKPDTTPIGQPLPGILITLVVAFGVYMIAVELRRRRA